MPTPAAMLLSRTISERVTSCLRAPGGRLDGKADGKGGALAQFAVASKGPSMPDDDGIVGVSESLACALADFFGGKKWIENSVSYVIGNSGAAIGNRYLDRLTDPAGGDG
jgi:hypothetical protein